MNIYSNGSNPTPQEKEKIKISYWLKKLFDQENNRKIKSSNVIENVQTSNLKAKQQATNEIVTNQETDKHEISDMVQSSNDILMSISTVFPFDLFTTTINVEATRVTIITRQLFSSQVHSIDIKNISSVFIETSILFAAITLMSKTYSQKQFVVPKLWKKEAILLRRVIEGLRMFEEKNINTTNFSRDELLTKLKELSETKIVL